LGIYYAKEDKKKGLRNSLKRRCKRQRRVEEDKEKNIGEGTDLEKEQEARY